MVSGRQLVRDLIGSHQSLLNLIFAVRNPIYRVGVRVMVSSATFDNISAISWRSVLLVEETGVPGEKHPTWHKSQAKFYHIMLHRVHPALAGFKLTTLVVIGTDCIGSCKSNYKTITATTPNL
jgi:hypothetical protein